MVSHDVTPLQVALNARAVKTAANQLQLQVDGVFGPMCRGAMQNYQRANKLTVSDQPTRELCDSLGIDLGPDFPYQPIAVRPPISINPLETALIGTALDAILPPSPAKEFLMFNFPSIVKFVIGLLPGLPDDVNKIRTAIGELVTDASDKNGIEGLRDSARFARIIADELDKVANTLDPSGAIQPANLIVNK
jgi:peptidoglycan hydrolase-like protein with peptidoglycan-binding domain